LSKNNLLKLTPSRKIAADVKKAKFKHALLLGMGGSSLCPEVLRMTFGKIKGFPELHVLDSTDPAQIKAIEARVDLKSTICIVSSKSGSTLEPNIYKQYFFERIAKKVARRKLAIVSLPLLIPVPKCSKSRKPISFATFFPAFPALAAAIRRCLILE